MLMNTCRAVALAEIQSLSRCASCSWPRGWTLVTALNLMLFRSCTSLVHERSYDTERDREHQVAVVAAVITTATASVTCWLVAQVARIVGSIP